MKDFNKEIDDEIRDQLALLPVLVKLAISKKLRDQHLFLKYGTLNNLPELLLKEVAEREGEHVMRHAPNTFLL